ncbi:MAG: carboxypeptidase-like regulatory domain-containing protein [Acidobacteria bacterium]|nr:carboxypeptidase-like regulatory domain-containing protein [Acidobacteriota bacterium]
MLDTIWLLRWWLLILLSHYALAAELCVTATDLAGGPLPGASVRVMDLSTAAGQNVLTDSSGRACVKSLAEGSYSLEVRMGGFLNTEYHPVVVTADRVRQVTARLPFGEIEHHYMHDAVLCGTLMSSAQPLVGAEICLFRGTQSKADYCLKTDELGQYAGVVRPAKYRFSVASPSVRFAGTLDMTTPGYYRNRIAVPSKR